MRVDLQQKAGYIGFTSCLELRKDGRKCNQFVLGLCGFVVDVLQQRTCLRSVGDIPEHSVQEVDDLRLSVISVPNTITEDHRRRHRVALPNLFHIGHGVVTFATAIKFNRFVPAVMC